MSRKTAKVWTLQDHIAHNLNTLRAALEETGARGGAGARRAVCHASSFTADVPRGMLLFIHVHQCGAACYTVRSGAVTIFMETPEEIESWVRTTFNIVGQSWGPEWDAVFDFIS